MQKIKTVSVTGFNLDQKTLMTLKEGINRIIDENTKDITTIIVKEGKIMSIAIMEKNFKMQKEIIDLTDVSESETSLIKNSDVSL